MGTSSNIMEPNIISVSRREDIPAFRAEWFMQKLKEGKVNMSNFYTDYEISFKDTKFAVFWSKNPKPMIKYLKELPLDYYFQFTLNDYPEYELNVPHLEERIETFKELSTLIGKEKVIWRFDPIIINNKISEEIIINRMQNIGDQIFPYTEKLIFSYIDPYKKLGNRFIEISNDIKLSIANKLVEINKNWNLVLSTCAEGIYLKDIKHNKCVDPDLIERICGDQEWITDKKDKSQRPACGCISSADVGTFKTCKHCCTYCYAN